MRSSIKHLFLICCIALVLGCSSDSGSSNTGHLNTDELLVLAKKAVLNADYQGLENVLKKVDVNHPLADGSSLLAWGIETQDTGIIKLLLSSGAQVNNNASNNPFSPLILACKYGNADIINSLLDKGADVNALTDDAISAFQLCAGNAPAGIIKSMIAAGALIDTANDQGQTPLMWAAAHGQVENMRLLLEHGADINQQTLQGFTTLLFAIKSGTLAAPLVAIEAGAHLNHKSNNGTSAAQLAMYQHNFDFAYWLIDKGTDLEAYDRNGHQLLHVAVKTNQPKLVQLLLEKGANPNTASGPSTLTWRYEANFKTEDYVPPSLTPLYMAAENGFTEIMKLLVAADASASFLSEDDNNIVLAAAFSGEPSALSYALEVLPEPKAKNKMGQAPLDMVLMHNNSEQYPDLLGVLKSNGVEIDAKNTKS